MEDIYTWFYGKNNYSNSEPSFFFPPRMVPRLAPPPPSQYIDSYITKGFLTTLVQVEMVEETEYDDIVTCDHSYDRSVVKDIHSVNRKCIWRRIEQCGSLSTESGQDGNQSDIQVKDMLAVQYGSHSKWDRLSEETIYNFQESICELCVHVRIYVDWPSTASQNLQVGYQEGPVCN